MMINQAECKLEETSDRNLLEVENSYWGGLATSLDRLKDNEDFKKLILEGYFKDKAITAVGILSSDYVVQNNQRSDVMEQLIAISQLKDYFRVVENIGAQQLAEED